MKIYQLGSSTLGDRLDVVAVYETIGTACCKARTLKPEHAAADFELRVRELLPSHARGLGEAWEPGESLDDWARLGSYLGALDGFAGLAMRSRGGNSPQGGVYAHAYSGAWMLAAGLMTPALVARMGGQHG